MAYREQETAPAPRRRRADARRAQQQQQQRPMMETPRRVQSTRQPAPVSGRAQAYASLPPKAAFAQAVQTPPRERFAQERPTARSAASYEPSMPSGYGPVTDKKRL